MGVKHFTKFYSDCEKIIPTNEFIRNNKNKIVVIDTAQVLYTYCIAIRKKQATNQSNVHGSKIHLYALYKFIKLVTSFGLIPFFVFDGKSPQEKSGVLAKRKNRQLVALQNIKKLEEGSNEYAKEYSRTFSIGHDDIEECKHMLSKLGYNYVHNSPEADCQCAGISLHNSNVAGVITNDSDVLMFGAKRIIKNFTMNSIRQKNGITVYDRNDLVDKIQNMTNNICNDLCISAKNVTETDFLNWNIMLGTDYCCGFNYNSLDIMFKYFIKNNFDIEATVHNMLNDKINISHYEELCSKHKNVLNIYMNSLVVDPAELKYNKNKSDVDIDDIDQNNIIKSIKTKILRNICNIPKISSKTIFSNRTSS